MDKDIKYTIDGKKVVVIGNLNSQEKIVQEIFIVNDCEVPSGEHFVVKSLYDAPAISWKEKELKRIESDYETVKFKYGNELKVLTARYRTTSCELKNKIEYAGKVLKNISPESFNTLVDYLTGEIKYIVKTGYSPELIEWKDFTQNYEDSLRLISIYGRDDGTLTYGIGNYSDYSGGKSTFKPFNNYEDALSFLTEKILEQSISDDIIKIASKYNIELPTEKVKEFKVKKVANLNDEIKKHQDAINNCNNILGTID